MDTARTDDNGSPRLDLPGLPMNDCSRNWEKLRDSFIGYAISNGLLVAHRKYMVRLFEERLIPFSDVNPFYSRMPKLFLIMDDHVERDGEPPSHVHRNARILAPKQAKDAVWRIVLQVPRDLGGDESSAKFQ